LAATGLGHNLSRDVPVLQAITIENHILTVNFYLRLITIDTLQESLCRRINISVTFLLTELAVTTSLSELVRRWNVVDVEISNSELNSLNLPLLTQLTR
jgi:hypothetical protein